MSTLTASIGGKSIDLSIFDGIEPLAGDRPMRLGFARSGGQAVAGIQRVAQWVAAFFITEKGTDAYDAEYGTDFVTAVRLGYVRSDPDVIMYFSMAVNDILRYFRSRILDQTTPSDERLTSVDLLTFSLVYPALILRIKVVSADGDAVVVPVPVSVI